MSRTILLADDSITVQKVVEMTFAESDFEVVSLDNGDDALERLDSLAPDLVIADIHMPGASGYEIAKRVKQTSSAIPVLLLVGTFEPFEESDVAESGADGYLMKPFDSQELLARVEALGGARAEIAAPESSTLASTKPESADDSSSEPSAVGAVVAADTAAAAGEPPPAAAEPSSKEGSSEVCLLSDDDVERIARRVVELMTPDVVRHVVRDVLPGVAEAAVDQRIRKLEQEAE